MAANPAQSPLSRWVTSRRRGVTRTPILPTGRIRGKRQFPCGARLTRIALRPRVASMRKLILVLAVAAAAPGLGGCPGRGELAGIGDSTFVAVMARLHRIETDAHLSAAERDSRRQEVLQEEGLTPQQLEDAARALSGNPERALAIWQAIEQKSRETAPPRGPPQLLPDPDTPPAESDTARADQDTSRAQPDTLRADPDTLRGPEDS